MHIIINGYTDDADIANALLITSGRYTISQKMTLLQWKLLD